MKRLAYCLLTIMFLTLLFTCHKEEVDTTVYSIRLKLSGFRDSTQFRLLHLNKGQFIDSVELVNGEAQFIGKTSEPFSARIHTIDNKYLILWVEHGEIEVSGNYDNLFYSSIEGGALNDMMIKYRDRLSVPNQKIDSLTQLVIPLISVETKEAKEELQGLMRQAKPFREIVYQERIKSIKTEVPSYYTLNELFYLKETLNKDTAKVLFDRFPSTLKATNYGLIINSFIEQNTLTVGDKYVDIEGINKEGQLQKLSDFHGKYILLDFWASWCLPCRKSNPKLVELYDQYQDQEFEIFGFSIDGDTIAWKKALEKDHLTWTNIRDANGSPSQMAARYSVRGIPAYFLINPQGIIIDKGLWNVEMENKLKEGLKN